VSMAWCVEFGRDRLQGGGPEVEALRRAGLSVHSREPGASGPGLVFFDEVSDALCAFLGEATRTGDARVLAVARAGSPPSAGWRLVHAGAADVLAWDRSPDPVADVIQRVERWKLVEGLIRTPPVSDHLVGQSPAWLAVLRQVIEAARFTTTSMLIIGESGTGKELVARLVHTLDPRPDKRDLVLLDCTTVVPELAGSEFFGHERGAFTGAVVTRDGAFAQADAGTLFLDEVGELPPGLQGQLLRVVQERTYKRVGGNTWRRTEFRLVCATNRDLLREVERGNFRSDLYHRVASWSCRLPPLRERREDILPLARHFAREVGGAQAPDLSDEVSDYLLNREYTGNVRELRQCIARLMYHHVGPGPLSVGDIPLNERPPSALDATEWRDDAFTHCIRRALARGVGLKQIGRAAVDTAVHIALHDGAGNLQSAARRLGVTDRALQLRRAARRSPGPASGEAAG
jgi:transcriptional regulator with GAF, ATPase, and Fis domain